MKRQVIFYCLAALLAPTYAFEQQSFTLDGAIGESMNYISEKLPEGTKMSVLKFEAPNDELAEYITVECENYIASSTPLSLAKKKGLAAILQQRKIADLNIADESEVLQVGRTMGAEVVIIGKFSKQDDYYKFFVQAFDAASGEIKAGQQSRVRLDELLADFTGEKYISEAVRKDEELARVKKELEELKAAMAAQQRSDDNAFSDLEARKYEENDDVRARLERQMNERQTSAKTQTGESVATAETQNIETQEKESGRYFVFSLRPEFLTGTGAMGVGGSIELGRISRNGFYFSADFAGGARYWGGGFNFGGCINKDGVVKNVLGVSAGFWNAPIDVKVVRRPSYDYDYSYSENNFSFVGAFWKLMFGRKGNFDITNKALFGFSPSFNSGFFATDIGGISNGSINGSINGSKKLYLNATYSLSVGYTLTKRKRK